MESEKNLAEKNGEGDSFEGGEVADKEGIVSKILMLAIFGFLAGFIIKAEAVKVFTMGFEDYKVKVEPLAYDLNQISKDVLAKQAIESEQAGGGAGSEAGTGGASETCGSDGTTCSE